MRKLPRDERGYPIPWFVAWVDGKPEFRAAEAGKFKRARKEHLCWVCGERVTHNPTFVIGPMCAVNRTTAEPPCHYACAKFSAIACPFLTKPRAQRREANLPPGTCAGEPILRNPGCCCLWVCRSNHEAYSLFGDGRGGMLFRLPDPLRAEYFAEARAATRAEVLASMESGLPILQAMARTQAGAMAELDRLYEAAKAFLPA
ncbi:MAG: hypothetical protein K8U03_09180 [Planctomycetia bacterium]|nr:hypothetical protein [Planctomycetia bacterium]